MNDLIVMIGLDRRVCIAALRRKNRDRRQGGGLEPLTMQQAEIGNAVRPACVLKMFYVSGNWGDSPCQHSFINALERQQKQPAAGGRTGRAMALMQRGAATARQEKSTMPISSNRDPATQGRDQSARTQPQTRGAKNLVAARQKRRNSRNKRIK